MNSAVVKEHFKNPIIKSDGKNLVATCKHCCGVQISGNISSSSNFLKHLKICGSDGLTHDNECSLELTSCQQRKQITLLHHAPCSGCENIKCQHDSICEMDNTGQAKCVCPSSCVQANNPVCASDNTTYTNECVMRLSACKRKLHLSVLHLGGCSSKPHPDDKTHIRQNCQCSHVGSYSQSCDAASGQCTCKSGVGGLKCDRCDTNYWGLNRALNSSYGCMPCNCDPAGSVREDCDQTTGRCVCRTQTTGLKCNLCPNGARVDVLHGCKGSLEANVSLITEEDMCDQDCSFSAICARQQTCVCPSSCPLRTLQGDLPTPVCGTDGLTYASACHLRLTACRQQKDTMLAHYAPCKGDSNIASKKTPRSSKMFPIPSTERLTQPLPCTSDRECPKVATQCHDKLCRCSPQFKWIPVLGCVPSEYNRPLAFASNSHLLITMATDCHDLDLEDLEVNVVLRPSAAEGRVLSIGTDGPDYCDVGLKEGRVYSLLTLGHETYETVSQDDITVSQRIHIQIVLSNKLSENKVTVTSFDDDVLILRSQIEVEKIGFF